MTSKLSKHHTVFCLVLTLSALLQRPIDGAVIWTRVGASGFGNPNNRTVNALKVFNGYLYAVTTNEAGSQVWKLRLDTLTWRQVTPSWSVLNTRPLAITVFREALYVGTNRGEIWKSRGEFRPCLVTPLFSRCPIPGPPIELWSKITVLPLAGSWVPTEIASMVVFGDAVYLSKKGAASQGPGAGLEIWRSRDGTMWERVVADGFGDPINNVSAELAVHGGQIYAGTARLTAGENGPELTGLEIWRSADGSSGHWEGSSPRMFGPGSLTTGLAIPAAAP
jgi:hypothetical protein